MEQNFDYEELVELSNKIHRETLSQDHYIDTSKLTYILNMKTIGITEEEAALIISALDCLWGEGGISNGDIIARELAEKIKEIYPSAVPEHYYEPGGFLNNKGNS